MGEGDYAADDCNAGADTTQEIDTFIGEVSKSDKSFSYTGTVSQILGLVNWSVKIMVRDGETDPDAIAKIKDEYLGLNWSPSDDFLVYRINVNIVPKITKVRPADAPDLTIENIALLHNAKLTLNVVASVVYSWFDPPGLICPLILKYKLLLSETIHAGVKWKEELPDAYQTKWKVALEEAIQFGEMKFPRTVKPEGGVTGRSSLVFYADGSKSAFGAPIYTRWKLKNPDPNKTVADLDGNEHIVTYSCRLLAAKAKIAKMENVARNEMEGLLLGARLVTAVLPGLSEKPVSILPILDSRCTIQSVDAKDKILKEFFNNRCEEWGEHERKWESQGITVEQIHHTPGIYNIADLATEEKLN